MGQQGAGFSLDAARETVCVCLCVNMQKQGFHQCLDSLLSHRLSGYNQVLYCEASNNI